MQVTAWNGGNTTYGIRIGSPNRDQFFDPAWSEIIVEIDGQTHHFPLTAGFWKKCPEFRSPVIREWFTQHQLLKWPRGKPHVFELKHLEGNHFRLTR